MTTTVPELTALASANDGEFPMLSVIHVIHVIDGRTGLRSHGGPMPVYGALFDAESVSGADYGDVLYTRGKILSVAYYLESIQKEEFKDMRTFPHVLGKGFSSHHGQVFPQASGPCITTFERKDIGMGQEEPC